MFGISTPHTGKRVAVADIGSGSAGVAILSLHRGKPAVIEASHRTVLSLEKRSQAATIKALSTALSESAEKVLAEVGAKSGPVQETCAVIRAPWVNSKTVCASRVFPKDERIDSKIIVDLGKEALASEKDLDQKDLIEANIVRVELNGYPTAHPEKKHAHIVTLYTLASECEARVKSFAKETLTRVFASPPKLRSNTGALLAVLRERFSTQKNYLVVEMGKTATSLFSVHKGTAINHALVHEGTYTILKRISEQRMPEETLSLIKMFASGHCEDSACEEIKAQMARAEPGLLKAFGEVMAKLAVARRLPNALVLVTEPDMASWLSDFFSRIDFTQFTTTTQPFNVEALVPEDLGTLIESSTSGKNSDLGLLIAGSFVNRESGVGH